MNRIWLIMIVSLVMMPSSWGLSKFYEDRERGWYWYEEQQESQEEEKIRKEQEIKVSAEELKDLQEKIDASKAAWIMHPTVANATLWLRYQKEMFNKSDAAAKVYQQALLMHPELDPAQGIYLSQVGSNLQQEEEKKEKTKQLIEFAKEYQLLFFYNSRCKYCSVFSEVVQEFAKRYGFKVAAVTADGKSLKGFPAETRPDLIEKFNIKSFPRLYAFRGNSLVPISEGFVAIDILESQSLFVRNIIKAQEYGGVK